MKDIGSRLREMRIKNGLTQDELAEKLHCGAKAISRYESDENLSKVYDFIRVCECLGEVNYIITGKKSNDGKEITPEEKKILSAYKNLTDSDRRVVDFILDIKQEKPIQYSDNTNKLINLGEIISIDTYPQPVSAGKGNIYIDDNPVSQLYPATPVSSKADYCARISGDSMYPNYLGGDFVYVDKTKELNNDDIGIFFYDGEAYCKKYYEDNDIKKLISLNPDQERYSPIVIENDTFEVQGKVIGRFHAD